MYCLSQFCCFCFRHNVKLKLLSKITYRSTTFHKIAKAVVPELLFSKHNHLFSVCRKCEAFIKSMYAFRQNCIKNIFSMMKYVKQLQSFGSESGVMRIHVDNADLPRAYDVIKTDDDELNRVECELLLLEDDVQVKINNPANLSAAVECDEIFESFHREITVSDSHDPLRIGNDAPSAPAPARTSVEDPDVIKIENDADAIERCEADVEMKIEIHDDFSEMYDQIKSESNDFSTENVAGELGPSEGSSETEPSTRFEQCMICEKSIALGDVKQHELDHFRGDPPKCLKCDEYLANICTLKVHKMVHNEKNIYKCQQCKESFPDFKDLRRHRETHRKTPVVRAPRPRRVEVREYRCDKCEKVFPNINALRIHGLTHVEARTYRCDQCGKVFPNINALRIHNLTHAEARTFRCEQCGKEFSKESSLDAHSVIHTGRVLYKCVKKTFNIRQQYGCKKCGRFFSTEDDLNRHALLHQKPILYKCERCERMVPDRDGKARVSHPIVGPSSRKCGLCGKRFCGDLNEKRAKQSREPGDAK